MKARSLPLPQKLPHGRLARGKAPAAARGTEGMDKILTDELHPPEFMRPPFIQFKRGSNPFKGFCMHSTVRIRFFTVLISALLLGWNRTAAAGDGALKIRGVLPWHNFLCGPSAWNEADYRAYLDRMKELDLNFIGFHCYTGGAERYATYVEPMIRIAYRNVLPEAGFDTGMTARWGYRPLAFGDFAFETGNLFPGGRDFFGADCAVDARSNEERYQKAQALMKRVLVMAHERDIRFAMGFEFGVYPPEFASIVPRGYNIPGTMLPDPTHPCSMEVLRITLDNVLQAYPGVDCIWLWLHEHTGFIQKAGISGEFKRRYETLTPLFADSGSEDAVFTGVWSLLYVQAARDYLSRVAPAVKLIVGGWGGGNQLPAVLTGLDRALPKDVIFTCLNPDQGLKPQLSILEDIAKNREVWAVPWLESDANLWHPQPRVSLLRDHVTLAARQNLAGVVAIHWRTRETDLNLEAFAEFADDPQAPRSVEDFYRKECESRYGPEAGRVLAPFEIQMDREQWFRPLESPEYYPYTPQWGRMPPELAARLNGLLAMIRPLQDDASDSSHRDNLLRLSSNLRFALLLDEAGRRMEPAYRLKERWFTETLPEDERTGKISRASEDIKKAPIEELFDTFRGRTLSRGELGVLSSVNQRLWLQYRELTEFLAGPPAGN